MERQLSTKKYLLAFFFTLLVFTGGILTGLTIEKARLQDSQQINTIEKLNLRSIQLQQNYIDSGIADCNALNKVLETNIEELAKKMYILTEYEKNSLFNGDDFSLQLRDYFLTEIQFLLISQEIDKKCQKDSLKIIYFYDENTEDTQGKILDYLKLKFKNNILIFSFNSGFRQEPMIDILMESYNINTFPSIVIDSQVFQGSTSLETLKEAICTEFKNLKDIPEECLIKE
jgi:hypothetical protein